MPVDVENAIAFVHADRKRTLGFHVHETDEYVYDSADTPVGTVKGVGLGILVEQPAWGSLWSWLDGIDRDDIRRLADWLRSIADGTGVQPPLDAGVDENIEKPQVTFEHVARAAIRLRLRGEASPAPLLDEFEGVAQPEEIVAEFHGISPEDVREAADFLLRSARA